MSASKKKNLKKNIGMIWLMDVSNQTTWSVSVSWWLRPSFLFWKQKASVKQDCLSRFPLLSDNHFLISNLQVSFYYASLPSFIIAYKGER